MPRQRLPGETGWERMIRCDNPLTRKCFARRPMELSPIQITALIGAWAVYGIVHSVLASLGFKHWIIGQWPSLSRAYRLIYNALAVTLLVLPLGLLYRWRGEPLWEWTGIGFFITNGLALLAIAGFLATLRDYDTDEFLGTRQWRKAYTGTEDQERLHISTIHRFVRHPWYFFALVIIWTRNMDTALLISALCMSGYFWLGSLLEERKLLVYHGAVYAEYRKRVPGLLPLPWRRLSSQEAVELTKKYRGSKGPGTE